LITQAAVLWGVGERWSVEEVTVDEPRAGEVLVRVVASGLCHSDDHFRSGDMPTSAIPVVGGHEGAGIVEQVGPGVTAFSPGDHVVSTFLPSCGTCRWCSSGRQNLCDLGAVIKFGRMLDGTSRLRARGQELGALSMIGTFGGYLVANQYSLVKIDDDIPLELACLLGCGVTTGWGSVVKTGQVEQGDTVVVVGCGGIGAAAIQGAKIGGAEQIVAVDVAAGKQPLLQQLGATHFATDMDEARELVREITRGVMADLAVLSVGVVHGEMIGQVLSLVRKAGTAVLTGMAPADETTVTLPLQETALFQKSLRGSLFGEANARADIPRLIRLYRSGQLQLDSFVTREYKLGEINEAFADMLDGRNIRGVIRHEH
jgi:S-(hydroxymethyl)glutathione dehydrogenase/alcohol dehydrogenase